MDMDQPARPDSDPYNRSPLYPHKDPLNEDNHCNFCLIVIKYERAWRTDNPREADVGNQIETLKVIHEMKKLYLRGGS
jgi:hypothetical protein